MEGVGIHKICHTRTVLRIINVSMLHQLIANTVTLLFILFLFIQFLFILATNIRYLGHFQDVIVMKILFAVTLAVLGLLVTNQKHSQ